MLASIPPYQRDARSKGIPSLGSGAIYPIGESEFVVDDFRIPAHWPRGYGLDVGWNKTAAIFGALDRDNDILYLYSEHYRGQAEPVIHATGIKARGDWIPGRIDPAARGRGQRDGEQLMKDYVDLGLDLKPALNAVEAGIYKQWMRLSTGRIKVFKSLTNWLGEYRIYRRDEKGKIVKVNDHLMDACLTPDTLIVTPNGKIPISDLVGKGGLVLSRCGSWLEFIGARKTIENTPVVKLAFADGSSVICTPDHPFLTKDGWVQASDMEGVKCYNGVTQRIQRKLCLLLLFQRLSKNSKVRGIISAGNTFRGTVFDYTEESGNFLMAQYQKAITSIIKMRIGAIITMRTFRYLPEPSISATIRKDTPELYRRRLLKPQSYGINHQKVLSGIKNTISKQVISYIKKPSLFVSTVRKRTHLRLLEKTDFVAITVKPSTAKLLVLTMKNAFAWFAAACSWRISILLHKHALENAEASCVAVTEHGTSDVYCLTVPAASAFCVESGQVVHNTRYLIMECENTDFMITKPIPKGNSGIQAVNYHV